MDDDQRQHLEGLRQIHLRRLRILEQQAAVSGGNTRPEVVTEIEDLQAEIAQIDAQLAAALEAQSASAATPARQPPAEPRRTQATILSAALAGASALIATLDPEDAAEIVGDVWQRLDAVVSEHGGLVDRRADDVLLAVWGARAAREDDPERAIRAALAMQAALADLRAAQPLGLALRVGISTGLILLGALGATDARPPVGSAVTLALQLQWAAPDDGILIAHDTYRHVRGLFAVEVRGQQADGAPAEPPQVYLVTAAKPRAFFLGTLGVEGVETRLIGRDAELARLQEAFQTVVEERELQLVTIIGEAGVGKSRLLHAFRSWEELQAEQGWLFAGRATQELSSQPYALLRDIFAFRFAIQDNDPPAAARDKLERGIASTLGVGDPDAVLKAHVIGQLLGFDFATSPHLRSIREDPKQLHDQALHYLSQFVGALTSTRPLLLVLEDLHWADDASLDALAALLRSCQAMPLLALCLARPALFERRPAWGEGAEGQTRLRLEPLSKRASRKLVEEILRRAVEVPVALREQIVAAAEGNPFYVEELIKMLIDERAIVPGVEVWRVEGARLKALHVPPTLTGVLQARLDSLELAERGSLERASVVGRIFWDRAVAHLGDGDALERIGALLEGLRRREMVFRHEVSAFAGASEYLFKHMLLREVTYERVLKRQRRAYHAQAAGWLIAESGERADEYAGLIAEHYQRAGETAQAAEWHARAGRQAQAAYANAEALAHYQRALAALPEEQRAAVLLAQGQVLELIGQWDAAEERYLAALALAADDGAAQGQCQQALGVLLSKRGDYAAARARLEQARAGALTRGERGGEAAVLRGLGWIASNQGDYAQARALYEESLALFRALGDKLGSAISLRDLGRVAQEQGDYAQARALYEESLTLRRALGDKSGIASTLTNLGIVAIEQGNYAKARGLHEESLAIFSALGDKLGVAILLHNLGLVAHSQGDHVQARGLYEESLALARALGDQPEIAHTLATLVGLAMATGQVERAVRLAGAVDALMRALGTVLESLERGVYDTAVNTARAQLDAATFAARWAEGQAMTMEQALAYALEQTDGDPPASGSSQPSPADQTDTESA